VWTRADGYSEDERISRPGVRGNRKRSNTCCGEHGSPVRALTPVNVPAERRPAKRLETCAEALTALANAVR
jgi:hypothetical protein